MALTYTTYGPLLKTRYTKQRIENLTQADNPFLAKVKKDPTFSGTAMQVPLIYGNPQGLATQSLAIAQSAQSNLKAEKFLITTSTYYGSVVISNQTMVASRDNLGAFLNSKNVEIDAMMQQHGDNLAQLLFGNGGGALGKVATGGVSGSVITLNDPSSVYAFEVGMSIVTSPDGDGSAGTETLRGAPTVTTVSAVDRAAGTVTVASIGAIAAGDYIFRYGDFYGSTGTQLLVGVPAFITAVTTPPALFGMTRTSDRIRLAGSFLSSADYTDRNNEERIKLLGSLMAGRYKQKVYTDGFMNPEDWQNLEIALQSRGIRPVTDDSTKFGFNVLKVGVGGTVANIYADKSVPKGTFFGLRMENWVLYSMLDLVHIYNADGLTLLRQSSTNDMEFRTESFPQLCTNAPGRSGRAPLN